MKRIEWRQGMGPPGCIVTILSLIVWGVLANAWDRGRLDFLPVAISGAVALAFLSARAGAVLRAGPWRLTRWWGFRLLFFNLPVWRRRHGIGGAGPAVLRGRWIRSGKNSVWVNSLFLGEQLVWDFGSYRKARREGERLAKLLGLTLIDEGGSNTVPPAVRRPGTLDLPLRERLTEPEGPRPGVPSRPRVRIGREGEAVVFEPARDVRVALRKVRPFLIGLGTIAAILLFELALERARPGVLVGAVGAVVGLLGGIAAWTFHAATRRTRLRVTPCLLVLETESPLSRRQVVIPVAELEELDVGSARVRTGLGTVLSARSDRAVIEFGSGIPREELEYLRARIADAIATSA